MDVEASPEAPRNIESAPSDPLREIQIEDSHSLPLLSEEEVREARAMTTPHVEGALG